MLGLKVGVAKKTRRKKVKDISGQWEISKGGNFERAWPTYRNMGSVVGLKSRMCLVGSKEGEAQECLAQKAKKFAVYPVN